MLFNSFGFLFGFLPIALVLTFATRGFGKRPTLVLTILSLIFYGWWRPANLPILLGSIVFNYVVGALIQKAHIQGRPKTVKAWLVSGVTVDVLLLGWFKYANFVAQNLNALGMHIQLAHIVLPLAISFFTFQKIAYLVDCARGQAKRISFLDFALFASFFPPLIAGPITHYKEVVPQFSKRLFGRLVWRNLLIGLVIFSIGLFKKTVIADTLVMFVDPMFNAADKGDPFNPATGWVTAFAYMFQLYFDFSGYSDMAIGLARMFGVKIPLNFHSPLRAPSIANYWRRWHMTLQRFLLAYVFQPLTVPLSRIAANRGLSTWPSFFLSVAVPSFFTFVVSGIWHGAGWNFIVFGVLHAVYISINQVWLELRKQKRKALRKQKLTLPDPTHLAIVRGHILTLIAVMFADVMFRATSVHQGWRIFRGMLGLDWSEPSAAQLAVLGPGLVAALAVSAFIVFFLPNSQQIMAHFEPALNWPEWRDEAKPPIRWTWKPSMGGLLFVAVTLLFGVLFIQRSAPVFIYFNF